MFRPGTALEIVQRSMSAFGLGKPNAVVGTTDSTATQFLSLLEEAIAQLICYYPFEQITREWTFTTQDAQDQYDFPSDFMVTKDQTQWDRTNHWPLLGPKSGQEWQWLKGGMLSQGPRLRYRIWRGKFQIHPVPGSTPWDLVMEYTSKNAITPSGQDPLDETLRVENIAADGDIPALDKWLLIAALKLKFWESKGFESTHLRDDFTVMFDACTGRDKGAPVLNMAPRVYPILIGPWSVPDGSWPVTGTGGGTSP